MELVGNVWSDGSVLCVEHTTDLTDEGNETGQAGAIFDIDETECDMVCDVAGCGIILARNLEMEE